MRAANVGVLSVTVLLVCLCFVPRSPGEEPPAPFAGEPFTVTLHFKGQGLTTADPAAGNSTEEKATANGRPWGGRVYGTTLGEWAFLPKGDFRIQGAFKAELWAQSPQGAKAAGFRLNFYVGNNMWDMYTDRADISSPHKFTLSSSVTTNVRAGVQVRVGLVWLSEPNYIVGPSSGGDFLYGSKDHDSLVSMTLDGVPLTMNASGYEREGQALKINVRVNDSLGMDPNELRYELMMTGPATVLPEHIQQLPVVAGDNGTMVSWRWHYRQSRAQSGLYTLTMGVAYCNDTKITNSTQMEISFPAPPPDEGLGKVFSGGNLYIILAVVLIGGLGGGGGAVIYLRRRRRRRARMRAEREAAVAAEAV